MNPMLGLMPHLVMPPFHFGKKQAHSKFSSKFGMHMSEEQNEGG
jgi:hypothetical protein